MGAVQAPKGLCEFFIKNKRFASDSQQVNMKIFGFDLLLLVTTYLEFLDL